VSQGDIGHSFDNVGIQVLSPICVTRLFAEHDQPHIRSPLVAAAPISRLRRAGAQEDETILTDGNFAT